MLPPNLSTPLTPDFAPYVLVALHKLGTGRVASALDLSREATLGVVLGIASKGSVAVARANLARLREAMGDAA